MQRRAGGQHGFVFAFCRDKQRRGSVCATDDADNGSVLRFGHEWVVLGRFALNRRIVLCAVLNGDEVFRRGRRDRIGHCGKSIRKKRFSAASAAPNSEPSACTVCRYGKKQICRRAFELQTLSRARARAAGSASTRATKCFSGGASSSTGTNSGESPSRLQGLARSGR